MSIKSLQDLNTFAQSPITYDDVRTAQVLFDRGATVDQTLVISENTQFELPYGININDITQYDVADVEYHIDLSFWSDPVSISWDFLPSHITVTRTNNEWIVSDIRSGQDWLYVREAKVLPPFGFTGLANLDAEIQYYSDNQDSTKNIAAWDITLTVNAVEYFSSTSSRTFTSNTLYSNLTTTTLINNVDDFDPVWDLRIFADNTSAIKEIFSDGSAAEAAWNNTTKQYVVTGDTESVNEVLATLDIETDRYSTDFVLFFRLANNFTSELEFQTQEYFSRDFISDVNVAFGQSCNNNYIRGFVADPFGVVTSAEATAQRTRDLIPTTISCSSTASATPTVIRRTDATLVSSADFECAYGRIRPGAATPTAQFGLSITESAGSFFRMQVDIPNGGGFGLNIDRNISYDYSGAAIPDMDIYINWGDGTAITRYQRLYDSSGNNTQFDNVNHNYSVSGQYDIIITGTANHFGGSPGYLDHLVTNYLNPPGGNQLRDKLYGTIVGQQSENQFCNSANTILGVYNMGDIDLKATVGMFARQMESLQFLPNSFITTVTDTRGMFQGDNNTELNPVDLPSVTMDLSGWQVYNVTNMAGMFAYCPMSQFNTLIGNWDVDAVTDMKYMFHHAHNVDDIDLNGWGTKTGAVTDMQGMFMGCDDYEPTTLNSWDTSSVTDMSYMFAFESGSNGNPFNGNISSWDTSSVTTMHKMFYWCDQFDKDISSWDVSNVTDFESFMHQFANTDAPSPSTAGWDLSSATTIKNMFYRRSYSGNIENWTTSTSLTNMEGAFGIHRLTCDFASTWNTSNVTTFKEAFEEDSVSTHTPAFNPSGLNYFDTSSATDFTQMFMHCEAFNSSDITGWNTSNVTSFSQMFSQCLVFDQNLGSWNTSSATSMVSMFSHCDVFNNGGSDTIKNWDVSNVTDLRFVFAFARLFNQPIDDWDISSATTIEGILQNDNNPDGATGVFNQPLNNWDTSSVTDMRNVFAFQTSFNQPLNNWDTSSVTDMAFMFTNATSYDQDISGWNVSNVTSTQNFDHNTSSSWTSTEKPSF